MRLDHTTNISYLTNRGTEQRNTLPLLVDSFGHGVALLWPSRRLFSTTCVFAPATTSATPFARPASNVHLNTICAPTAPSVDQQNTNLSTGWPKATTESSINRIESRLIRLHLFVKLKCQSSSIMLSFGIKYFIRDLTCDVNY